MASGKEVDEFVEFEAMIARHVFGGRDLDEGLEFAFCAGAGFDFDAFESVRGAPQDVRDAMAAMIKTVEENAGGRRTGGDTNAANDKVAFAKRDLLRALDKWRGQPY